MAPKAWRSLASAKISSAIVALAGFGLIATVPNYAGAETMEAALARAYQNNPQLNVQRAIVRQTDENVPQALSGYRPTVTANATVQRQYTSVQQSIPPTPGFLPSGATFSDKGLTTPQAVGATVTQNFFNGFQTTNKVGAAENQ